MGDDGLKSDNRSTSRKWSRYCASLARSLTQVDDGEAAQRGEGAAPGKVDARVLAEQYASHQGARGRRAGLVDSERCSFWMKGKTRYCSRPAEAGSRWCCQHRATAKEHEQEGSGAKEDSSEVVARVPCELCGVQVLSSKRTSHTSRCAIVLAQKALQAQPYFCCGFNSGPDLSSSAKSGCEGSGREPLSAFAARVAHAHRTHVGELPLETRLLTPHGGLLNRPTRAVAEAEPVKQTPDEYILKHLQQSESIVANLQHRGLLSSDATYVEFGAGKGMLSLALSEALQPESPRFLLVERDAKGGMRNKADRVLKPRASHAEDFERLKIDIRDLKLAEVPMLTSSSTRPDAQQQPRRRPVVAVSKHLCGIATDLALRCLHHAADGAGVPVEGVAIALCCHHCCELADYAGRDWWERTLGFSQDDFDRMRPLSGWATGCRASASLEEEEEEQPTPASGRAVNDPTHVGDGDVRQLLSARERVALGRKCKQLIDAGRVAYLRSVLGLHAQVVQYCDETVSAENSLLLAWASREQSDPTS